MRIRIILPLVALTATASAIWAVGEPQDEFLHEEHEGLFPLCTGCHSGIDTGVEADRYPSPEDCVACHDGEREDSVVWAGPSLKPSNVAFSHPEHVREVGESTDSADCATCHQAADAEIRMAVEAATAEGCLQCHAHEAREHLSEGRDCSSCHVPLTEATEMSQAWVDSLSKPVSHEAQDFILEHDPLADADDGACATCHALESCTRCHVNSSSVSSIAALGADPRVAHAAASRTPEYPEPGSHLASGFDWTHGALATEGAENCANCHTQTSCLACHRGTAPPTVATLSDPPPDDPRGVVLSSEELAVHQVGFSVSHGAQAAAMEASCEGCHVQGFCVSCHDGPTDPGFHPGNFLAMHAPEAYGNEFECTTCHNTEVFCRSCHTSVGLASEGGLSAAFHNANPFWLVGHGQAARQGLESCTTCHTQVDCTQCHAAGGGWSINPHGPGFDPTTLDEANFISCTFCHRGGIPR